MSTVNRPLSALYAYAYSVRNLAKRRYAERYIHYVVTGSNGEPPAPECTAMAAQAVRHRIAELLGAIANRDSAVPSEPDAVPLEDWR
jgi:hypothetical protein